MPYPVPIPEIGTAAELAVRTELKNRHRGERAAIPKPRLLATLAAAGTAMDRRALDELLRAERQYGFPG